MIIFGNGFGKIVAESVKTALEAERDEAGAKFKKMTTLREEITKLRDDLETLKIEKGRRTEDTERREREIQHKLGLHKKQVEHEQKQATESAKLEIERAGLDRDRLHFEERMEFHQTRFEEEVKYQRGLLEKMLKQLPSAEIFAGLGGREHGK